MKVAEFVSTMPQLTGATLEWWALTLSLGQLAFQVRDAAGGSAWISTSGTSYIDFGAVMHNIRLGLATEEETEHLRQLMPEGERPFVRREDHLVIHSSEGRFHLLTPIIRIDENSKVNELLVQSIDDRLWPPGLDPASIIDASP